MTTTNTGIALLEVSDVRKEYLARWRFERRLDKELSETGQQNMDRESDSRFEKQPFCPDVLDGDIRLLPDRLAGAVGRFLYVAVLFNRENGTSVVAPFSTYSTPCCKDEWLTGLDVSPLRVLQLWNTQPVPTHVLASSWRTGYFSEEQLDAARELYTHALRGTFPGGRLRETIGLAISTPSDDRLEYQREEYSNMARLRQSLFHLLNMRERLVLSDIADKVSSAEVPTLLAAAAGEMRAQVLLLGEETRYTGLDATNPDDSDSLAMRWMIEPVKTDFDLTPGLPAFLHYKAGPDLRTIEGWTTQDGHCISFVLANEKEMTYLSQSCNIGYTRIGIMPLPML